MNFYTNVQTYGSRIFFRGIENGQRVRRQLDYFPTLFAPSPTPTAYTTIHGDYVGPVKPGSLKETKEFLKTYEDVDGFKLYGNERFEYCFISDNFPEAVKWNKKHINVCNIDIEVASENGFPEPELANEEIVAITFKMRDKFVALGCQPFKNTRADVQYIQCTDEIHLIKQFLDFWSADYPDVITGWYVRFFDIPYLVNRITKLLGEKEAKRLSPWGVLRERIIEVDKRENQTYILFGISTLDGIELYKKFVLQGKKKPDYKLGNICQEELGVGKLSYQEYGTLHTLYKKDYQKFIEYNIRDVELVEKLDAKHKMVDLVLTLAYDNKCNFDDAFQQVRMWDTLCYNKLKSMNMVVPSMTRKEKKEQYVGAFVKEPIPGKYKFVVSFDLDSLYPHLIMQYNISPDMLIDPKDYTDDMRKMLMSNSISVDGFLEERVDLSPLKAMGVTMTPNGQFFRRDKAGFLTEIMEVMYNDRKRYKKAAGDGKKKLKGITDPAERRQLEDDIARNNNMQMAKKVSLNSAYGAMGSEYFRFFDVRLASAITTSGQLAIQWCQNRINAYLNSVLNTNVDYIVASDTDSMYITLDEMIKQTVLAKNPDAPMNEIIDFMQKICDEGGLLANFIEKTYKELADYTNAFNQCMHMKRESLADAGIWTGKKRYGLSVWDLEGLRFDKPEIKVTGLEMVKAAIPQICKDKMKESLKVVLHGSQKEIIQYIDEFRDEFNKLDPFEFAIAKTVNGMSTYHTTGKWLNKTPAHVKASMTYNRMIDKLKLDKQYQKIKDGDSIRYLYLKEPNPARNECIAFPTMLPKEFGLDEYVDYNTMFDKSFLDAIRKLLGAIGWYEEEVTSLAAFYVDEDEDED
jgi:DNA polymerase elongation subunit (family B)